MTDSVLRRIKRCMDLSSSSNENEAALALKQMQALMKKHGITSQQVLASDVTEHATKTSVLKHPPKWTTDLHITVGQAMDCESIIRRGWSEKAELVYLGVGTSTEVAGYAFEVLYRKLKQARQKFIKEYLRRYKSSNKAKMADAYCEGWVINIYSKVKNLNPNIDVAEKIKAYKETGLDNFSDGEYEARSRVKKSDSKAQSAKSLGYMESADVNLFAATGHSSQGLLEG